MGEIVFKRHTGYTNIPNAILRDPRLSLKTKGLFAVMFSLPEDWDYNIKGLAHINGVGRDAIRSALEEMEAAGYLTRQQAHGQGGKFSGNIYEVRDESSIPLPENPTTAEPLSEKPLPGKPMPVKPLPENPTQYNKDLYTKDPSTPYSPPTGGTRANRKGGKRAPKSVPDWKPERFEGFWKFYPRHEDRVSAVKEWDKLLPSDELIAAMAEALTRQKASQLWQEGIGIPYACRWLRNRRWEDKVPADVSKPTPGLTLKSEDLPTWT